MTVRTKEDIKDTVKESLESKDTATAAAAIVAAASEITEKRAQELLTEMLSERDMEVLRGRGVRQLTSEEKTFYQKIIDAGKAGNFKDAITDIDKVMPETIVDNVFDDIEQNHALLSHLDIKRVNAKIKILYTAADTNEAVWGKLTDKITEEIAYGFEELDAGLLKLSAFIPVPQAYLDLGPVYLDRLTRTFLYEALAKGLEKAIVLNLSSAGGPISMMADMSKGTTASGVTTYTSKTAIKVTDWTPKGLAAVMKALAKTRKGNPRPVSNLFCAVNPEDYYTLITPAVRVQNASGDWVDRQPYPVTFVQSAYIPAGKAIMGMDNRYILGVATDTNGKIETSDEYQFLDDNRVYKIKLYGNGQPKDNTSFAVLDISELKEAALLTTNVTNNVTAGA